MSINMEQLYNLAKEGKNAAEIMQQISEIKSKGRLEQLLYRLSIERKEVITVPGLSEQDIRDRKVTKTGIHIPATLLDSEHIVGTVFRFETHDDKIVLNLIQQ